MISGLLWQVRSNRALLPLALAAGLAMTQPAASDTNTDPLSAAERRNACSNGLADVSVELNDAEMEVARACLPNGIIRKLEQRGWEILLVERRQPPKAATGAEARRAADVYVYNYRKNVLHHLVIDVANGRVRDRKKLRGVQLPLTENEVTAAVELAFADATVGRWMREQYRLITNQQLTTVDQLDPKAFVFNADVLGGRGSRQIKKCGVHRCAQLAIAINGVAFDLQPIVSLSRQWALLPTAGGQQP